VWFAIVPQQSENSDWVGVRGDFQEMTGQRAVGQQVVDSSAVLISRAGPNVSGTLTEVLLRAG